MALWGRRVALVSLGIFLSLLFVVGCTKTDSSPDERSNLLRIGSIILSEGAAEGFDQYRKLSGEAGKSDNSAETQSVELANKLKFY